MEEQIIDHQVVVKPIKNNHIALSSLFLGPLTGARLTYINSYIHLGKKRAGYIFAIEIIVTFILLMFIPQRSYNLVAGLLLTHIILVLIVVITDRIINASNIQEYVQQGVPYQSTKKFLPAITLYFILYIFLMLALNLTEIYSKVAISKYEKYNGIIFYEKDIDSSTLDKIAEAMHDMGYFNPSITASLTVVRRKDTYLAMFSFYKKDIIDESFQPYYNELKLTLVEALKPEKVQVIIMDENREKIYPNTSQALDN